MGCTTKTVKSNGDKITWVYEFCNKGNCLSKNNFVDVSFSAGQEYLDYTASKGAFDGSKWTVGSLDIGECATITIKTKVTDITLAPFTDTALGYGDNVDPDQSNNQQTCAVEATTCPAVAGAFDIKACCGCGDVSKNDTPCSHGTTTWVLVGGSEKNLIVNNWDEGTGQFDSSLIDPSKEGTFQYKIFCSYGGETYETAGPALVTVPAGNPESPCLTALREYKFCGPIQKLTFQGVINEDEFVIPGVDLIKIGSLDVLHNGIELDEDELNPLILGYSVASDGTDTTVTLTAPSGDPGSPCRVTLKYQICETICEPV